MYRIARLDGKHVTHEHTCPWIGQFRQFCWLKETGRETQVDERSQLFDSCAKSHKNSLDIKPEEDAYSNAPAKQKRNYHEFSFCPSISSKNGKIAIGLGIENIRILIINLCACLDNIWNRTTCLPIEMLSPPFWKRQNTIHTRDDVLQRHCNGNIQT